jgi:colanic acid/amylovoran biosynthesis glycosyltransferase
MRIAVVASRFPVLSETFVLSQVTGLLDRGHDVVVFADRPESTRGIDDALLHRYDLEARTRYWPREVTRPLLEAAARAALRGPRRVARALTRCVGRPGGNRLARQVVTVAAEAPFDAILCHFGNVALDVQRLRDLGALEGRLAAVFHAFELTTLLREKGLDYYRPLFERAERIMPVSEHWARELEALGCPPSKILVHHMGVDCQRLTFSERKPPAEGQPVEVLSVARLVEKKGIAYAIEAVARVTSEGIPIRYRIVGDGPLRSELEARVRKLDAGGAVEFLGARSHGEVLGLLDASHLFLAPSVTAESGDKEGIPVSIMEAMARGLVVVSTEHSGIPELVEHEVSGLLAPERDADALATILRRLAQHPDRWAALSAAARTKVVEEFNQDRLNDRLEEELRRL